MLCGKLLRDDTLRNDTFFIISHEETHLDS